MYRFPARRMLRLLPSLSPSHHLRPVPISSFSFSSTSSQSNFQQHSGQSPSFDTSSSAQSTAEEEFRRRRGSDYQDEQPRVLSASLRHVPTMGWTEAAMIAGAREAGVSPSIVGSLPRKEAALVEFFMDGCLQKLIDAIDSDESLKELIPSERISKLVRIRLELQAPFISKWAQALSVQAQPQNIPTSFKQRAMLVDEIWHAAGDDATDIDWYTKRTVLGAIYSTTEVYMLTDSSPDFRDTWSFLDNRVKDAFELKKSFQEARYLAETVGAGMGSSFQGFVNNVLQR